MRRLLLTLATILGALVPAVAGAMSGHLEGYVPAAAHGAGRFGSFWTTDLWIYQQGASVIHLWFNRTENDNTNVQSKVVTLDRPVVHIRDVVATLFGTEGLGSIHYLADGPVVVVSRTWTPSPNGGTYGQTIPGIPLTQASVAGTGQGGALRMLVNQRSGFRANLGLVNVSPVPVTVAVEVFTSDGNPAPGASSFTANLGPFDMRQIGDVLSGLDAGDRDGLIIRAGVTSGEGAIVAYLSTVDNTTNDASYQEAFRFGF